MNNPISEHFDSRDLIEFKEFLEEQILDLYTEWAESHNEFKEEDAEDLEIPDSFDEIEFIDEEAFTEPNIEIIEEYEAIKDFCEELESYGDFEYGETIISEDYFKEYSKDLCKELGYIPDDLPAFIEDNIDWQRVADDLKVDYMEVDYCGTTYLMRA